MSDYIPVKKLSVEDQKRIYRELFKEKPVRVKADPKKDTKDTLEDKLRQKEAIEEEYRRRRRKYLCGIVVGLSLHFIGSFGMIDSEEKGRPYFNIYKNNPIVVEYLDREKGLELFKAAKRDILEGLENNTSAKITKSIETASYLEERIESTNKELMHLKGKEEVKDYSAFQSNKGTISIGIFLSGLAIAACFVGCLGKNYRNKERELKALGFYLGF